MTRRFLLAGLLVLLWTGISSTQAPAFVIIVNKANPVKTLPIAELRRIFMKQSRMWPHAEPMVPVDWDSTSTYPAGVFEADAESIGARDGRGTGCSSR